MKPENGPGIDFGREGRVYLFGRRVTSSRRQLPVPQRRRKERESIVGMSKTVIVRQVTPGADPDRIWIVPVGPMGDTAAARTARRLAYIWASSEQAERDVALAADEEEADPCAIMREVLDFIDPDSFEATFVLDGQHEIRPAS